MRVLTGFSVGVLLPGAGDRFINPSTLKSKLSGLGGLRTLESGTSATPGGLFFQEGRTFLFPVGCLLRVESLLSLVEEPPHR